MSPIKGLTDRLPSFPQIGTIRKGAPMKTRERNGRRYAAGPGEDLQHFRVEFMEGEEEAGQRFVAVYGEEPREITVMLPFNEIGRCWEAWKEAYVAGALIHRCDGETVQYALDRATGEVTVRGGYSEETGERVACDGSPVYTYTNSRGQEVPVHCAPRGRLRVIIPELRRAAYLLLVTGSVHDILNISSQLEAIKELNGGELRGIPLVLRRRPRRISTPGPDGKRVRREKWLVSVEADPRWVEAKVAQLASAATPHRALLDDGDQPIEVEIEESDATLDSVDMPEEIEGEDDAYFAFLSEVCHQIPYYGHPRHVENALTKLGLEYNEEHESALYDVLSDYANRRANEKAVAESGDQASMFDQEEEAEPF